MITRSRKYQRRANEDSISPSPQPHSMITRSRKRQKDAEEECASRKDRRVCAPVLWLDKMPVEIRQRIAIFVSGGKLTDDGLNLARTSELQRHAVVTSMPRKQNYVLEMSQLSEAWAELLADHCRELTIMILFPYNRKDSAHQKHALFLPLLRGARLEKVAIQGVKAFLDALIDAKGLRELCVIMRRCSRRRGQRLIDRSRRSRLSLSTTLRRRGLSLSSLTLKCTERNDARSNPPSNDCPMSLCLGNGSRNLTSLCPALKELVLKCCHIPPSTVAFLICTLPLLESMGLESAGARSLSRVIDLSEEDVVALRTLDRVSLENVAGGVLVAARIGRPVVSVNYEHPDNLDAALDLVNCPMVREVEVQMGIEEWKRFTYIVPWLSRLRKVDLRLASVLSFKDVEDAVMEAVKIVRMCHQPAANVLLRCRVSGQEGHSKEELDKLTSNIANMGGRIEFRENMKRLMCYVDMRDGAAS